jgi:hypothetical protein
MSEEPRTLVPVRTQTVDFYGDALAAAEGPDARIYVPLKPIADALGLTWPGQSERTRRHPVLGPAVILLRGLRVGGGNPTVLALPLDLLPGWLFGINADRVKPELRDKITRYQAECFRVLWEAFRGEIGAAAPMPAGATDAERALVLAEAVAALARQQVTLEARQGHTDLALGDHARRLNALEVRLDPKQVLTEEQAAELALAVKTVGQRLASQGDRQGYAKVYSELYRRYRVASYKNLPQGKFAEVLAWLAGWAGELE